jgi:uncharacterized membrane protein YfcA
MATAAILGGYLGAIGAKQINPHFLKAFIVVLGYGPTLCFFWRGV